MKRFLRLFFFVFLATVPRGEAEEIKKIENFIYSIHAFDGRIYRSTFAREAATEVFCIADRDSFLSTRKTFIYYFPAMEGYRLDTDIVNYQFKGTLEISGNGINKNLDNVVYTYTNIPEERATAQTSGMSSGGDLVASSQEGVLRVYKGENAKKVWDRYQNMLDEYRAAYEEWEQRAREFQAWQKAMVQKIRDARQEGKDTSGLVSEVQTQHAPFPPERPNYTVEPLLEAFVVNLPVGNYRMKLRDQEGYIVEGSEKELVVFKEKRSFGVCYQYAAYDKIAKSVQSPVARSVIYIDGTSDLYIGAYYQDEYNEFLHNKLVQNDSVGSTYRTKMQVADKITDSWLEVYTGNTRKDILLEELYYIQTDTSKGTGYSIVIWDGRPDQPMQYVNPNFSGFLLPAASIPGSVSIKLRNIKDTVYEGSQREVRIVHKTVWLSLVFLLALVPIGAMIWMTIRRIKLYSKA